MLNGGEGLQTLPYGKPALLCRPWQGLHRKKLIIYRQEGCCAPTAKSIHHPVLAGITGAAEGRAMAREVEVSVATGSTDEKADTNEAEDREEGYGE